jgi:hypothetical protein
VILYNTPKTILQQKLNETLTTETSAIVSDLVKLSLLKMAEKDEALLIYGEIYKLLGVEKFSELVALINGRTLEFPTKDEFQETITTVLCYYYRNVECKDWADIKSLLGDPDLNTIKYGIRATSLGNFIGTMMGRISNAK